MKHFIWIIMTTMIFASAIYGSSIIGGSTLLNSSYLNQMEQWLGNGPLTLNNIYTKQSGHTASNFHAASDGKGDTFSIIEILSVNGVSDPQIVGFYNPKSWYSTGDPIGYSYTDPERTAFLFNLTKPSVGKMSQKNSQTTGTTYTTGYINYQSYNKIDYGPSAYYDLYVYNDMSTGWLHLHGVCYGYDAGGNGTVTGGTTWAHESLTIGRIEVFSISEGVVPEPHSIVLLFLAAFSVMSYLQKSRK